MQLRLFTEDLADLPEGILLLLYLYRNLLFTPSSMLVKCIPAYMSNPAMLSKSPVLSPWQVPRTAVTRGRGWGSQSAASWRSPNVR